MSLSTPQRLLVALTTLDAKKWHQMGLRETLFEGDTAASEMYTFMAMFVREHGKVPSLETLNAKFGYGLPPEAVDPEYLFSETVSRRIRVRLGKTTHDMQTVIKTDPVEALRVLHEECTGLLSDLTSPKVYDLKQAFSTLWPWLIQKWAGITPAVPLYYPSLQSMMGGAYGGEIISTIGRAGLGKTWTQIVLAMHVWKELKQPVLFVSMEMMIRKMMERMIALYTFTSTDWFKHGDSPTLFGENKKAKVYNALVALEHSDYPPFLLVDGNLTATSEDVLSLAHAHKPAAVFVDGAYMLRTESKGPRLKGFENIEEVCKALKGPLATNMDIPVFASWQFNREATKVKKGETPELQHIAGGDWVGFVSSLVMGLGLHETTSDESTGKGDPTNAGRRKLTIIKGRDGESGEILTNWNFAKMDFSEIIENGEIPLHGV